MINDKTNQNDIFSIANLLYHLLFHPPEEQGHLVKVTQTFKHLGYEFGEPRTQGDAIAYSEPVKIDGNNLAEFGFKDDINTYKLDADGNLSLVDEDNKYESTPEHFLLSNSESGDNQMQTRQINGNAVHTGLEDESLYLRRVELDGETIGYMVSPDEEGVRAIYLGTDDIDFANLPEEMQQTLRQIEVAPAPEPQQQPSAPAISENYTLAIGPR